MLPKKTDPRPACAQPECKKPPLSGSARCVDHQFKPLTVRQRISQGPAYNPVPGICAACGGYGDEITTSIDRLTGLGVACWRAWRFAQAGFVAPAPIPDV